MSEFHEFLDLWRDLYRVERKVVASEFGVSPTQYGRIEAGQTPLSASRLRALGKLSNTSLNTLLLAFMLMDENVDKIASEDPGDRLISWLHQRLASEARRNESNSSTRHFLGQPRSLENMFDALQYLTEPEDFSPPQRTARLSTVASS